MQKPRRRSLGALATVLVATTVVHGDPSQHRGGGGGLLQRRRIGAADQRHRRLDDRRAALDRTSSGRSSASTSRTTQSRAGAPCFRPAVGGRATHRTTRQRDASTVRAVGFRAGHHGRLRRSELQLRSSRRRGDGRGDEAGHPDGDVADTAQQRVVRRPWRDFLQRHVPRHQPDPAAEGEAVRSAASDRRLGGVFGEPSGVVLLPTAFTSGRAGATVVASYIASQAARVLAGQVITPPAGLGSPSAPRSLTAWVYPDRVTLTWSAPSTTGGRPITAYLVQRSTDGGRTWVNVAGVPYPNRVYTVTGLDHRNHLSLPRRRQERPRLEPPQQRRLRHTPAHGAVASAVADRVGVPGSSDADVDRAEHGWGPADHRLSGPTLDRRRQDVGECRRRPLPSRIYTVTGLTTGTTYHFRVAALNTIGWSRVSNVATATPQLTVPWPPRSLTAVPGDRRVALRWTVPASNGGRPITAYLVQRSTDGGRTWVNVAGVPYPSRLYTVTGLTNGTAYRFRVAALNSLGWSRVSDSVAATPRAAVATALPPRHPPPRPPPLFRHDDDDNHDHDHIRYDHDDERAIDRVDHSDADTVPATSAEPAGSTIGDFVWLDGNGDGLQDPDEARCRGNRRRATRRLGRRAGPRQDRPSRQVRVRRGPRWLLCAGARAPRGLRHHASRPGPR